MSQQNATPALQAGPAFSVSGSLTLKAAFSSNRNHFLTKQKVSLGWKNFPLGVNALLRG